ncbi:GNAT family N-acetyltransferase [Legionella brunensis]|uniref:GNAT family acetyltransferase n=1 Tax=Legionella brunensis TaxID=29422 RepID=A0A0W0S3W1_9GAMM|nr:GNAT family protein [Legionella brunensis]KTC78263.1 GNAT family acetyltransferase [Legionella brunensis]
MIKANNLCLRVVKEKDLALLYMQFTNPNVRGDFYSPVFIPEKKFYDEFAQHGFWTDDSKRMAIVDHDDFLIGMIHVFKANIYSDCIELSYIMLDPHSRNKGFMTQALKACVCYLFESTRSVRIQLTMPNLHKASIRVAEKSGFKKEGLMRRALLLNGQDHDLLMYAIIKEDWSKDEA